MRTLLLCILLAFGLAAHSQNYKGGVGVRFGYGIGGTIKVGASPLDYIEAIGTFGALGPGVEFAILYERHVPFYRIDGLSGVFGIGPGVVKLPNTENHPGVKTAAGIDPIIGLDYTLRRVPLNFTVDFKPRLQWRGGKFEYISDFGASMRYVWGWNK